VTLFFDVLLSFPLPNGAPRWRDMICQFLIKAGPSGGVGVCGLAAWMGGTPLLLLSVFSRKMR